MTRLALAIPDGDKCAVYRARDLAALLQLSVRQIWRLSDSGMIPGRFNIGSCVRWNREVIDKWIAAGCPRARS
jgi:predicted DNA-binding transcriptional regulator AlpA